MNARAMCVAFAVAGLTINTAPTMGAVFFESQPISISTAAELDDVRNDLGAHYVLIADIDLTNVSFVPIGSAGTPFTGTFDGNGYGILNWTYGTGTESHVGLFSAADGAVIKNLDIVNVALSGLSRVGGLAGLVIGGTEITNCTVTTANTGKIEAREEEVGGLIGRMAGSTVKDCATHVTVEGGLYIPAAPNRRWAGGLIGHIHVGSTVENCETDGDVSGYTSVGGLAGNLHGSTMTQCESHATVTAASFAGGLLGYMQEEAGHSTTLSNSCATGQVTHTGFAFKPGFPMTHVPASGGLVGFMENDTFVHGCHATGAVMMTASQREPPVGGLVGWTSNDSTVTHSWASGDVTGKQNVGGLVGWHEGKVDWCCASGAVSGLWTVGGLLGSVSQPSGSHAIVHNSFATGPVAATGIFSTTDKWQSATGGLAGYVFDGNHFFRCGAYGAVDGGNGRWVGGLIGRALGSDVEQCFATGVVQSSDTMIGGLIGQLRVGDGFASSVEDSYAHGDVLTTDQFAAAGGLVGDIPSILGVASEVTDCYSVGFVANSSNSGGLVGTNGVSGYTNVVDSFWDTQTSGQSTSQGGVGKTTSQMMMQSTFPWDFADDSWAIIENQTYPFLASIMFDPCGS